MPGFLAASEKDPDLSSDGVLHFSILDENPFAAGGYVVDDGTGRRWRWVAMQKALV